MGLFVIPKAHLHFRLIHLSEKDKSIFIFFPRWCYMLCHTPRLLWFGDIKIFVGGFPNEKEGT